LILLSLEISVSETHTLVAHPDCHSLLKSCMFHFRNLKFFFIN
jgi:hypothetical protein